MLAKKINKAVALTIALAVAVGGYFIISSNKKPSADKTSDEGGIAAVIYKSPSCGCCVGYIGFLKKRGFQVETKETADMNSVKQEHDIPPNMQSCHTVIVGDYFVEGHIPLEVVNKLLAEKPDLDGIALPGMPSGSPGMPGLKTEDFIIYGLKDGQASEYMRI